MSTYRFARTIARFLRTHHSWLSWDDVPDPRQRRGRRWPLPQMLQTVFAGVVLMKGSMRALDAALARQDPALARLGAPERIPDATLQEVLPGIPPEGVRPVLVDWVRHALRSKVLDDPPRAPGTPRPLRFAAVDGKKVYTGQEPSNRHSQRVVPPHGPVRYLNRVLRVLWLGPGPRLVLDQRPVEARSNDMGTLLPLIEQLEASYGSLAFVEGFSVDAGMTSRENAAALDRRGLAYLMGLKANQPELFRDAQRVLEPLAMRHPPEAETRERYRGTVIQRQFWRTAELVPWPGWPHLKQVWLVRQTHASPSGPREVEDRYFVTNLPWRRAPATRLLALVRQHWWIENQCFWRLDVDFEEEKPWSTRGWGPLVMGLLLCLAFNVLHLLRDRRLRRPRPAQESFIAFVEAVAAALVYQQGYEAGRRAALHG
jgi:Transposase DDE domain